jgi:predicted nucleic acid-binding Zn ribbon protein
MRRSKTQALSEALGDYISDMRIERKLMEVSVVDSWEQVVGKMIASKTSLVYIKKGKLFVHIKSSVVKNELMMIRETLRAKLNERAGVEVVSEIVLK